MGSPSPWSRRGGAEPSRRNRDKENRKLNGFIAVLLFSWTVVYVRHIGTKTMRMKRLSQTVTAGVDTCVMRKNQSR